MAEDWTPYWEIKPDEWKEGWEACMEDIVEPLKKEVRQLESGIELLKARLRVEGEKEED